METRIQELEAEIERLTRERDEWSGIAAQRLRETQLARADYEEQIERRRQVEHERDVLIERIALLDRMYQRMRRYLAGGSTPDVPAPQAGGCIHCGDDEH